jgi:hypothetical protein
VHALTMDRGDRGRLPVRPVRAHLLVTRDGCEIATEPTLPT